MNSIANFIASEVARIIEIIYFTTFLIQIIYYNGGT